MLSIIEKVKQQLLVICTANICRSPMAAGLIRSRVRAEGRDQSIEVCSAGTQAVDGRRASDFTVELLAARGIAISQHASRKLAPEHINEAHVILVMEESHRLSIFHQSPENLHKVILLSELANQYEDIADPYGFDKKAYEYSLIKIQSYLDLGWNSLLKRLEV